MKLYIETFGCRANHYDSETVRAMALASGAEIVGDARDADVAVFNSCAVTAQAERDLRKSVRRAAAANGALRSVVMGCASALPASSATLRPLPTVEHVIGGADLDAIASALGVSNGARAQRQSTVRANLRIQDGCDEHCTFCATTLARGANRSRDVMSLVAEAARLAEHHGEIVITGTHIGSYGADTDSSLGALMEGLMRHVPTVRFRLSSVEATEVSEQLVELMAAAPGQLVPHLHAPLQSGSNRVLRRMGRHWYTAESYAEAVERLATRVPVLGLGADVIVGFPGETDDDFRATASLIEQLPFTYLHVFAYSPRPGTAATRLSDQVHPATVHERSRLLRELSDTKAAAHRAARAGRVADAIVISAVSAGGTREALTEDFLTVTVGANRPRGERFSGVLRLEGAALAIDCGHP